MDAQPRPPVLQIRQRGAAAIEFAFILPLLLLILGGTIEFGRAMWHYDALAKAARDAARYLSTVQAVDLGSEAASATSTTRNIVDNAAISAGVVVTGLDPLTYIAVTCQSEGGTTVSCAAGVDRVSVAINYPFVIGDWIPLIGPGPADAPDAITIWLAPHVTMPYMQ